jgi:hypothetical protein
MHKVSFSDTLCNQILQPAKASRFHLRKLSFFPRASQDGQGGNLSLVDVATRAGVTVARISQIQMKIVRWGEEPKDYRDA